MTFLILAHAFVGSIGSRTCQSRGMVLLFRITQKSLPCGICIWPWVWHSTLWIFPSSPVPSPSPWPPPPVSSWKPFWIAQVEWIPPWSVGFDHFIYFPSILVDIYLPNTYYVYTWHCTRLRIYEDEKRLSSGPQVAHSLIGETLRGEQGSPTKENQFVSDITVIMTFKKLAQGLFYS